MPVYHRLIFLTIAFALFLPLPALALSAKLPAREGAAPTAATVPQRMTKAEEVQQLDDAAWDLLRQDQCAEAEAKFSEALHLAPAFESSLVGRAWARMNQGMLKIAGRDSAKAIKAYQANPTAWVVHALILIRRDKPKDALYAVARALDLAPTDIGTLEVCSQAFAELGQNARVVQVCDEILYLDPKHAVALNRRALALASLGDHEGALKNFLALLELRPDSAIAWSNAGNAYLSTRRYDAALEHLNKALEINPRLVVALFNKALALSHMERHAESLNAIDQGLAVSPNDSDFYSRKGDELTALKRTNEALAAYSRAIELNPKDFRALNNRALLLKENGKWQAARLDMEEALRSDNAPVLRRNLAWLLATCPDAEVRDGALAVKLVRSTTALPTTARRQSILAAALAETGDYPSAVQTMREAISLECISSDRVPACSRISEKMLSGFEVGKPWREDRDDPDFKECGRTTKASFGE